MTAYESDRHPRFSLWGCDLCRRPVRRVWTMTVYPTGSEPIHGVQACQSCRSLMRPYGR
jgi:hypothetical protein